MTVSECFQEQHGQALEGGRLLLDLGARLALAHHH